MPSPLTHDLLPCHAIDAHQFGNTAALADDAAGPAELSHVGDRLRGQRLQLVRRAGEEGDERLQTAQTGDRAAHLRVARDHLQHLQRADLDRQGE